MPDDDHFHYDCFLSHNSKDKPAVRTLAKKLKDLGLRAWLDEEQMQPGGLTQDLLEAGIRGSLTVAVLIGGDGEGPWQDEEVKAALSLAVEEKRRVIPVLLPTAPDKPDLPLFLRSRTWVDLRLTSASDQETAFDNLYWGITGKRRSGNVSASERITRIIKQLLGAEHLLSSEDSDVLLGRLARFEKQGLKETDEALLDRLERLFAGSLSRDSFLESWRSRTPAPPHDFDFRTAAADWCDGRIALFLGQDLPSLFGGEIPPTRDLPRILKDELEQEYDGFGGTVAEVAELVELDERSSRTDVRRAVARLAARSPGPDALHELVAEAPSPLLVLTTAYDTALEERLRAKPDRHFMVASPSPLDGNASGIKLDLDYWPPSPTQAASIDPDVLSALHPLGSGLSLIYRLRGSLLGDNRDSLLITEGDYVRAVRQARQLLPDYVAAEISARQLWFIGYDPRRWEDRLLVRLLLERRERSAPKAIVVQPGTDRFARAFWSGNRVTCVDGIEVPEFVASLSRALP